MRKLLPLLLLAPALAAAQDATAADVQTNLDFVWVVVAGALSS